MRRIFRCFRAFGIWIGLAVHWACAWAQTPSINLIADPGFENSGAGWQGCGGVQIVSTGDVPAPGRMIRSGVRSARLASGISPACDFFSTVRTVLAVPLTIPEDATQLTLRFWYARAGSPVTRVRVAFADHPFGFNRVELPALAENPPLGWHVYQHTLAGEQLASIRGKPRFLLLYHQSFDFVDPAGESPGDSAAAVPGIYVDDFELRAEALPLPIIPEDPGVDSANLLEEGGFENGAGLWEYCGGTVERVDAAAKPGRQDRKIRSGTGAFRVGYRSDRQCNRDFNGPNFFLGHRVAIPTNATALTVTFWYSRLGDPETDILVGFESGLEFRHLLALPPILRSAPTGWTAYHHTLTREELNVVRGRVLRLTFMGQILNSGLGVGVLPADPPVDAPGVYLDDIVVQARNVPKPVDPADPTMATDNLVENGGMEDGWRGWELCGEFSISDRQKPDTHPLHVRTGRHALRLNYHTNRTCGLGLFAPHSVCATAFTVPPNASEMTVSFWYSRVGDPRSHVWIKLATEFGSISEVNLSNLTTDALGGWTLYRETLNTNQLAPLRGKRVYLAFYYSTDFGNALSPSAVEATPGPPGFYIDDVRVAPRIERTQVASLPSSLAAGGDRPLLLLSGLAGGIARVHSDGSNLRVVDLGAATGSGFLPVWNHDGSRIFQIQQWLYPTELDDPVLQYRASTTIVSDFEADGGPVREIGRTTGTPGRRALPLGCNPGLAGSCIDPEIPSLDLQVIALSPSPAGERIAFSMCAGQRYHDGRRDDSDCWIQIQTGGDSLTAPQNALKIPGGSLPRWSAQNRILFVSNDSIFQQVPLGIREADMTVHPPEIRLLVPNTGVHLSPSLARDVEVAWAPDGRHFASVRSVVGKHWEGGGSDLFTHARFHRAIFLHDRLNPGNPRHLLLSDHGDIVRWIDFAPDGRHLFYTLIRGGLSDIWWLDVETGATGPVTTDGLSSHARWRPGAMLGGDLIVLGLIGINQSIPKLRMNAPAGNYSIEVSADLKEWKRLFSIASHPGGAAEVSDSAAGGGFRRFYRARRDP